MCSRTLKPPEKLSGPIKTHLFHFSPLPTDQPNTAPLFTNVDQPGEDDLLHHPTQPIVGLPDVGDQQPPDPPDQAQGQGQLRRSSRVARKRYACLDLDKF